ncbi:MAG: DNA ligase [Hydrogenophilales bacterium]|nr:DNA ligase [Hydrogenophilales bacterium]
MLRLPRPVLGVMLSIFLILCAGVALPASPPILAEVYDDSVDPTDYWISEKLDGVRALWDGQVLTFRSGNPVSAPDWFTRDLPKQPLDGELWLGRGSFERLSGIVRKTTPVNAEWRAVRYMLFELPGAPGNFSERKDALKRLVEAAGLPWLHAIEQYRVADRKALKARLDAVVAMGGEGLMLHRAGDSSTPDGELLKLKPYLDADARVIGHLPGKGRHAGRLGALLVAAPDGRRFRIGGGFSDAQRGTPPPVGSTVIYRYHGLTRNGLPRFPVFLRLREAF